MHYNLKLKSFSFLVSLTIGLILICPFPVFSQDDAIIITSDHQELFVQSTDIYVEKNSIEGINSKNEIARISFGLRQQCELTSISVEIEKDKKSKKLDLKSNMAVSTMDWSSFFTGTQTYTINIPPLCKFKLNYLTTNKNTLFISEFHKGGSYRDAKEYSYTIQLPDYLMLSTKNGLHFTESSIKLDSTYFRKQATLNCLIHSKNEPASTWFSNWFYIQTEQLSKLNPSEIPHYLIELAQTNDRKKLAEACFQFVKNEVNYIDIENGDNAIIPRPAEQTLKNGMGDCKDMANLLHALYKHFKFESYLGISKTNALKDTFDFPSIGLANHMIVALKLENEFIFLDATEDECLFGDPSFQILGTEVFLINHEKKYFHEVSTQLKHKSDVSISYELIKKDVQYELVTRVKVHGKMNRYFASLKSDKKLDQEQVKKYFSYLFKDNRDLTQMSVIDTLGQFEFNQLISTNLVSEIGANKYLDAQLFPELERIIQFFHQGKIPKCDGNFMLSFKGFYPPKLQQETENKTAAFQRISDHMFQLEFKLNALNEKELKSNVDFYNAIQSKPLKINI